MSKPKPEGRSGRARRGKPTSGTEKPLMGLDMASLRKLSSEASSRQVESALRGKTTKMMSVDGTIHMIYRNLGRDEADRLIAATVLAERFGGVSDE